MSEAIDNTNAGTVVPNPEADEAAARERQRQAVLKRAQEPSKADLHKAALKRGALEEFKGMSTDRAKLETEKLTGDAAYMNTLFSHGAPGNDLAVARWDALHEIAHGGKEAQ
jgi:hypothetical protein